MPTLEHVKEYFGSNMLAACVT